MRLPSLSAAARDARETLQRFPAVLFAALVAAAIGMIMAGRSGSNDVLTGILAAASLGLPLFLATAIAAERTESRTLSIVLAALGLAILVGFAFAWLHWSDAIQVRRYAQFSIGFHLLVAYLPYVFVDEPNGFWHWNRTLFLRFLTAALYSAVLYVGLVVALVAIDKLLQVKIPSSAYLRLWIAIAFVFNTWFFLGGVPRDLAALESRRDYPRGLKVFSQFILIPLVIVYLAILTLYLGRILITGPVAERLDRIPGVGRGRDRDPLAPARPSDPRVPGEPLGGVVRPLVLRRVAARDRHAAGLDLEARGAVRRHRGPVLSPCCRSGSSPSP